MDLSGLLWSLKDYGRRRPLGSLYDSCEVRYPNWAIVCSWFTHGSCVSPSYDPANAFDHLRGTAETKLWHFLIVIIFKALWLMIGE